MPYRSMLDNYLSSQRPLFSLSNKVWNPPTDIFETDDVTVIKMEVAGLEEQHLQIIAQRNMLMIRGRREQAHAGARINYHLMEVHYGEFERSFAFSFTLDQEQVKATYEKGFLVIEVRRQHPTTTRVSVEIISETR